MSSQTPHTHDTQDAEPTPTASEVVMALIATSHRLQRAFMVLELSHSRPREEITMRGGNQDLFDHTYKPILPLLKKP